VTEKNMTKIWWCSNFNWREFTHTHTHTHALSHLKQPTFNMVKTILN